MDWIIDNLGSLGAWGVVAAGCLAVAGYLFGDLHRQAGRGWWVANLRHDAFGRRYRALLLAALDWLDARLTLEEEMASPRARAWSHGLLELCLLLAVAYPILSVIVDWAVTGDAGRIASLEVIPAEDRWWVRATVVGSVGGVLGAFTMGQRTGSIRKQNLWAVFGLGLGLAGALTALFAILSVSIYSLGAGGAITMALAVSISVTFATAAPAGVYAALVAWPFISAFAVAVVVGGSELGWRTGLLVTALTGVMVVLFATLSTVVTLLSEKLGSATAMVFLFCGFLPLLNAAADFLSTGLTRYLLRRGATRHLALNAVIDAGAALAILLGLGVAVIATVHLIRPQDGAPMIDLAALFADLRQSPGDYYWLYFCFLSTLLPTFLHLGVGALGLFTEISARLGRPIAAGLASGNEAAGRAASLAFCICVAASIWLPVFLVWQVFALAGPWLLDALLDAFEGFARAIGALPRA